MKAINFHWVKAGQTYFVNGTRNIKGGESMDISAVVFVPWTEL